MVSRELLPISSGNRLNGSATSGGKTGLTTADKIRVGLVGVGNWGRYGHIPALRLLPEYEIVAVSSRRQETAAALASEFGIRHALADFHLLSEHPEVDLVVVLPPAPEHARVVKPR